MSALLVRQPGLFTTVQDLGRFGAQALGMPVAGAIDPLALRLANALAGNKENEGALEIGFMGPTLEVQADSARIAFVGAVQATIQNGDDAPEKPLATSRSHTLKRGQIVKIGFVSGAAYAYCAVAGGFELPRFMDSLSTYTRAGLGGYNGRKLEAGDVLPVRQAASPKRDLTCAQALPYGDGAIKIVKGPQADYFTDGAFETLLASEYVVTKETDRMGMRLDGPVLAHSKGADIVSDGIATGCIQVPGAGTPIVLLADHQTIGGYPKIATVASADLPRLGQMMPGQRLRFAAIDVAQAETLRRQQEETFKRLLSALAPARPPGGIDVEALGSANLIDGMVDALGRT
ncbi:MAG: allophanate hydrolase [Alphaproteobacteria bacterium]|nr:allophanate hydrolase [Alphaproteobacteria bacterium]